MEDTSPKLSANCLDGKSLFAKFLKLKIQVDYPDGAFAPSQTPRPVELIWGFVNPMNLSPYTTPTDKTVTADQITQHCINVIANACACTIYRYTVGHRTWEEEQEEEEEQEQEPGTGC